MSATSKQFKVGDHVRWNSDAGRVSEVIIKKITFDTKFKGYMHHASREAPQYFIKSDETDHAAIHKASALRLIPAQARKSSKAKMIRKNYNSSHKFLVQRSFDTVNNYGLPIPLWG